MRRYGIGAAEVDAMIEAQGGLCAICRERKPEHVDHDHETGKNRGITCSCCNQGLGNFRDRIDLLELAADYLAEHDPNAAARRTEAVTRLAGLDLPASIEAERRQIRDRANGDLGQAT
jgi:hypothetical protein